MIPTASNSATALSTSFDWSALDPKEQSLRLRECADMIAVRGALYAQCRFANFIAQTETQQHAVRVVRQYGENLLDHLAEGRNLILFGPRGTGKDHLLAALMNMAIRQYGFLWYKSGRFPSYLAGRMERKSLRWVNGMDLFSDLRSTCSGNGETEREWVGRCIAPDVLAISDPLPVLGPLTEWQKNGLFRVVDRRYSHLKPLWITLNVRDRAEMDIRFGDVIADRLIHNAIMVPFNWQSYRERVKV